ncbi:tail fiber domain-containing protein [Subsaxibacter sp. CAU 1640]|uniref:tail fiber domain-containing protein n=1 Tax=Subsaxibacter sp. CAU 1640 TaxID=2933271 RepID=UPI002004A75A|nr:tail fiber domain-containing protein [Subsaxibacter sp. CAU 1640]MCK7589643.1 tail fiber domain-containing protein [Subsaxibacter sp. CAU 1640]
MKHIIFTFTLLLSAMTSAQIGIGTTTPDPSSVLEVSSTTAGVLVPRMTQAQRLAIGTPATGLLVYQTNNTVGFWFYDGTVWRNISTAAGGEFQSIGGIIQNTTDVANDDFVVGDTDLIGSGIKMYFDKSKGAFRVGESYGSEWNDVNVGIGSTTIGAGSAPGNYSFSILGQANGDSSVAMMGGETNSEAAFAFGDSASATGDHALAFGPQALTNGDYAIAMGYDASATGVSSVSLGDSSSASGDYAFAGTGGDASGIRSAAFHTGMASGDYSFSVGGLANGNSSVAMMGGETNSEAAFAFGDSASATGDHALAFGPQALTNGDYAIAMGYDASATGVSSVSLGDSSSASGDYAFAGTGGDASGIRSAAFHTGTASGDYSFSVGGLANGNSSVAMMGGETIATALNSFALGEDTEARGVNSRALGTQVISYSFNETVLGYASAAYTPISTTANVGTDRLFVVANNTSNNALTMLKNGRMGLSRIPTTNLLEVNGTASKSTAGDWLANSDSRLKKNIVTFSEEQALQKLLQMRGVTYEWNDTHTGTARPEGIQYGFIAQELMEVYPENVELDNQGFYQTAYGTYDAMYVQAIKALNTKIEQLEKDNQELKNLNNQMMTLLEKYEQLQNKVELLETASSDKDIINTNPKLRTDISNR